MIRILICLATTLLLQSSLSAQLDASSYKQPATNSMYIQGGYFHDAEFSKAYGLNTLNIGYLKSKSAKTDLGVEIRYQAIDTEGIDVDIQFLGFDTTVMQFISDTFFVHRIKSQEELSAQFVIHKNYLVSNDKIKVGVRYGIGYLRRKEYSLATDSNVERTNTYNALSLDANFFGTLRVTGNLHLYVDMSILEFNTGIEKIVSIRPMMEDFNNTIGLTALNTPVLSKINYIHVGISYDF